MNMIQIRGGRRFNIYAGAVIDGVRYPNFTDRSLWPAVGITEVPEPQPPADYDDMKYQRVESDAAPYLAYVDRPVAEQQSIRWTRIVQIREELTLNGGCFVADKWFHTDVHSKQQQMALVMLGEALPADLWWKTMDGSFITMTPALALQLFGAQVAREQSIFAIAEAKRTDGTPLDEGWPERYVPAQPDPEPVE
jgi:hypothetical protein